MVSINNPRAPKPKPLFKYLKALITTPSKRPLSIPYLCWVNVSLTIVLEFGKLYGNKIKNINAIKRVYND